MKFLSGQLSFFLKNRQTKRNLRILMRFVAALVGLVLLHTVLFQIIMIYEGQRHSWVSGFYWVMVVMSTLGFGDITFQSDLGRIFSVLVILSGVIFLLVMLPFAFIQFFLSPWLEAQSHVRAPRKLPDGTRDHVILTHYDAVTVNLMRRLKQLKIPYVLLHHDLAQALALHDLGIPVMVGELDQPETYRLCRAEDAAMVVVTGSDMLNTSTTFTVREVAKDVPILANVDNRDSVDVLQLAGATYAFEMKNLLGRFLARRATGMSSRINVIGTIGDLLIAEASASRTPLVGKTVGQSKLREATGVTVAGLWERGKFVTAGPDAVISPVSVLILAGTQAQLDAYDELFCIYVASDEPVVILGGGRVGLAAAKALEEREMDYRIVEKNPAIAQTDRHVVGSAADIDTLHRAGLHHANTVIITTSDDDTNIYLTVYCRKLFPELQIIARASGEQHIGTLHRAGADFVMSYASMGSSIILNVLRGEDLVMFAEGLTVMRVPVPENAAPRTVVQSHIREETGSSIIAITHADKTTVNPPPDTVIDPGDTVILIGDPNTEPQVAKLLSGKVH